MKGIKIVSLIFLICSFYLSSQAQFCNPTLSTYSMNFNSAGGNQNVTIYTSCKTVMQIPDPWITVSFVSSGSGNRTYKITVDPYSGSGTRTATVNFVVLSLIKPPLEKSKEAPSKVENKDKTTSTTNGTSQKASDLDEVVTVTVTQTGLSCPSIFTVTGGGTRCSYDTDYERVGLDGSEIGVSYQLYKNGTPFGAAKPGTGSSLPWQIFSGGVFTVVATRSGCIRTMSGSATVIENFPPTVYTVSGGGCTSGETKQIVLNNSESNVDYTLKLAPPLDNVISIKPGTGGPLTWESSLEGIYIVTARANGCNSNMSGSASIKANPTITNPISGTRCGSGVVSLGATASAGTVNWYTTSSGGSAFRTGTTYNPSLTNTTTYYVDATFDGCTTPTRTPVTGTIKPIPSVTTTPDENCGPGVVTLGVTPSGGTVDWYDQQTEGNFILKSNTYEPTLSTTTTFYVEAVLNNCTTVTRVPVTATIKPIPSVTTTSDENCGPGTLTLSATPSGGTVDWYNASGTFLQKNNSYSPTLSTTTTFYVEAVLNNCTTVTRVPVTGTISSVPTITSTTPDSRCGSGPVTLEATASAGTVHWYLSETEGTEESTGSDYAPTLTTTTPYYVDAVLGNCTTATRTEVIATVNPVPTEYNVTPVSGTLTGPGEISLENTQAGVTYIMYRDGGEINSTTIVNNGDPLNFGEQSQQGVYTINGTIIPCTVLMPGSVALSTYELFIDATGVKAGSSCDFTGITANSTFPSSNVFNFYPEALPYTASLTIQNGTSTENIQFDIDENATILNVLVEKNSLYVPLNPKYYRLLQDENSQNRTLRLGPKNYQSQIQLGGLNGIVYDNQAVDFSLLNPTNVTGSLEIFDVDGNPVSGGITGFSWNGTDGVSPVPNGTYKYKITINQDPDPAIVINGHLIKNW